MPQVRRLVSITTFEDKKTPNNCSTPMKLMHLMTESDYKTTDKVDIYWSKYS